MEWLWKRINEASTWAAFSAASTALGTQLHNGATFWAALVGAVMAGVIAEKGNQ